MATSPRHARWMIACYRMLVHRFVGRTGVYLAIYMLVYYERWNNGVSIAPDVFLNFGVPLRDRSSYKVWEAGKPPNAVWEFGPPSSIKGDAGKEQEQYRRMGAREYWLVDPSGEYHYPQVQGFELVDGKLCRAAVGRASGRHGDRVESGVTTGAALHGRAAAVLGSEEREVRRTARRGRSEDPQG